MNYFAKNLTYCRKVFGLNQTEVAQRVDRGQSTIGGWENKVSEPEVTPLLKLSQLFGISLDHLVKTDLEAGNYITEEHIQKFKDKKLPAKAATDGPVAIGFDEDEDQPGNIVNEDEPFRDWVILKVLKEMDQKLDKLLITGSNK